MSRVDRHVQSEPSFRSLTWKEETFDHTEHNLKVRVELSLRDGRTSWYRGKNNHVTLSWWIAGHVAQEKQTFTHKEPARERYLELLEIARDPDACWHDLAPVLMERLL